MKVMIFNPATLEQREVDDHEADRAERELGWVRVGANHPLVAMFHPGANDHKMVLSRDVAMWEDKGYYAHPTCVYHPQHGTRTVSAKEAKEMLASGWFDSPAKFSKTDSAELVDQAVKKLTNTPNTFK